MIILQILNIQKTAPGKPQQAAKLCKNIKTSVPPNTNPWTQELQVT